MDSVKVYGYLTSLVEEIGMNQRPLPDWVRSVVDELSREPSVSAGLAHPGEFPDDVAFRVVDALCRLKGRDIPESDRGRIRVIFEPELRCVCPPPQMHALARARANTCT